MTSFLQAAMSGCRVQQARRPVNTFEILRFCEKQVNKIFVLKNMIWLPSAREVKCLSARKINDKKRAASRILWQPRQRTERMSQKWVLKRISWM
jgi:hypothetical protein